MECLNSCRYALRRKASTLLDNYYYQLHDSSNRVIGDNKRGQRAINVNIKNV